MTHAINSSDVLGRPEANHDAHVMTRMSRSVTVVFWPNGAYAAEWSYFQPEMTDAEMATAAAKGFGGSAYIYRTTRHQVNTMRDNPSAVIPTDDI